MFYFLGFWSFNIWSCDAECTRKGKNHSFAKVRPEEEKFIQHDVKWECLVVQPLPFQAFFSRMFAEMTMIKCLASSFQISDFHWWLHYLSPILFKLQHRQGKYRNGKKWTHVQCWIKIFDHFARVSAAFSELLITESHFYLSFLRFLSVAD